MILLKIAPRFSFAVESHGSWVTVGELKIAEIFASHMPSWKAKKLGEVYSRNLSIGASK